MILYRYILRAHVAPFIFALVTLIFIFLLQFVMKFIDQLIGKGLSIWVITELIALNLAWIVVLAVPMSVLVATLMAFGGLSSNHEITAMKVSGMSFVHMMAPVLVAATVLTVLVFKFDNNVLPDANHRTKVLMTDIRRKKPTLALVPGLFSQDINGYSILVKKTFEHTNDLEGVTVYDYTNPNTGVVITAERGSILFSPDYRKILMDLRHGEIHELVMPEMKEYRKIHFEKHRIAMAAEGFEFERSPDNAFQRGDRELSIESMQHRIDSLHTLNAQAQARIQQITSTHIDKLLFGGSLNPASNPTLGRDSIITAMNQVHAIRNMIENELGLIEYNELQIDRYMVEIQKKYSIPFACIIFVLVGVPLGIIARRGGFGVATSFSFFFFLLYWAFLIGGEKLADRGFITPFMGMWSANILIGLMGIYLTIKTTRETLTINWPRLRRFVPKRWLAPEPEEIANP